MVRNGIPSIFIFRGICSSERNYEFPVFFLQLIILCCEIIVLKPDENPNLLMDFNILMKKILQNKSLRLLDSICELQKDI